ncbi:hypothetical protein IVB56_27225 [Bradyrhizobium sp. CW7]|uniref:hypothetical protein n=1 Tax=Bradyrhizobium sp. CW7 TaxID=2782688 RepID=UPI001FF71252|nr:hypothetical protein [Bradyrhizobium sp. CW7]MCK1354641.1 hypothetical protein [Bradyrhizobium sp. CW7]
MSKRLTDIEIAARIVPTMLRWPSEAKTIAWDKLRSAWMTVNESEASAVRGPS